MNHHPPRSNKPFKNLTADFLLGPLPPLFSSNFQRRSVLLTLRKFFNLPLFSAHSFSLGKMLIVIVV